MKELLTGVQHICKELASVHEDNLNIVQSVAKLSGEVKSISDRVNCLNPLRGKQFVTYSDRISFYTLPCSKYCSF